MINDLFDYDCNNLFTDTIKQSLLCRLVKLETQTSIKTNRTVASKVDSYLDCKNSERIKSKIDWLEYNHQPYKSNLQNHNILEIHTEEAATDSLIQLFNILFNDKNVQLVRGQQEPEYFPATNGNPARIEFAHGFFASALHEISHWCIAGCKRRLLSDFGYWYAPDGRSAAQQQAFERLEIKPQALECLFTLAYERRFQVSLDNLFANFDISTSTFKQDVYNQVTCYIDNPDQLPIDAKTLLQALLILNGIK